MGDFQTMHSLLGTLISSSHSVSNIQSYKVSIHLCAAQASQRIPASHLYVSCPLWRILNVRLSLSRVPLVVVLIPPPSTYDAHCIPGQMGYVIREMTYLAKLSQTENIDSNE